MPLMFPTPHRLKQLMDHHLSSTELRRIDLACDKFEQAWRSGGRPRLEDYLRECDRALQPQLIESLQRLQQELILKEFGEGSVPGPTASPPPVVESRAASNTPPTAPARDEALEQTLDWAGARVILRVVAGPHAGTEFVYDEHDTLLAGRSTQAQLRLKGDAHFSRHHFRLEVNPPTCYLMDLRSRNGTFVNGNRVSEQFLKDGDLVSGGRTKIRVAIQSSSPRGELVAAPRVEASRSTTPSGRSAPIKGQLSAAGAPAAATPSPAAVPPRGGEQPEVHGYQIHEVLGAGDLGTTYRATRLASGEVCALKVISPAARADEKAIQNFLREVSILKQLQHSNIVRLIEMGASRTDLFLSMEFLAALRWAELSAGWSVAQKVRIASGLMCQVLAALEYAHSQFLVHRDVKPANVLIYRSNGKLAAKLADFGLAKCYTTAGMSQVTREGDVIGSLPYMSPEQFINSREAKPGCDVYSAGATLYWMLAGQDPIVLENHPCKFLAILEDPPMPLLQRCPGVPAALAQVVHKALEKSPDARFTSAAEMRLQLRTFAR